MASRVRLGLPSHDDHSSECACRNDNAITDVHHGLSCLKIRRTFINLRHDMVKDIVHLWARRLGCSAIKEPQNLVAGQERADNLIATPSGDLFLCDVSVVQPACPTHVRKSQQRLGASDFAAAEKRKQYDPMAKEQDAKFIPLIAEVYGALHYDFVAFIKRISWFADYDDGCPWSRLDALVGMTGAIAVAIQKGNMMALDRVQLINRTAGLVVSRSQSQRSVGMPAVSSAASSASVRIIAHPADAADDSFGGESDDIRSLPEDVKRSDVRVIIPRAISQGNDSGYDSDDDSDDSSVVLPEGDKARDAAARRRW